MYSFVWLCESMRDRKNVTIMSAAGGDICTGMINSVSVEDGSGKNWLVSLALVGGGYKTIFVKAE